MYACVYMCVCIFMCVNVCVHVCVCTLMCVNVCTCVFYLYVREFVYVYMHAFVPLCV